MVSAHCQCCLLRRSHDTVRVVLGQGRLVGTGPAAFPLSALWHAWSPGWVLSESAACCTLKALPPGRADAERGLLLPAPQGRSEGPDASVSMRTVRRCCWHGLGCNKNWDECVHGRWVDFRLGVQGCPRPGVPLGFISVSRTPSH